MVVIENDSPADNWIFSEISSQLTKGEGIIDWNYQVVSDDTTPLEDIEKYNDI